MSGYRVEWEGERGWSPVFGSTGQRDYALGWYHALTSFRPRRAYRLVRMADGQVIEEDTARGAPKPAGVGR